jgi:hypothetical protein
VTYAVPGVPGAMASATLNAQFMAERVEVRHGNVVTEFTYADYADYNNPLNKVDAFYAGTIVRSATAWSSASSRPPRRRRATSTS